MKTCNHRYAVESKVRHRDMKSRCPHPDIFERSRPEEGGLQEAEEPGLPIDAEGLCIFHSTDVEWKRQKGFARWFARLVRLVQADPGSTFADFRDFQFVGAEREDGGSKGEAVTSLVDLNVTEACYFVDCTFLDPVEIQGCYLAQSSFAGSRFHQGLSVWDSVFRGFDMRLALVQGRAWWSNVAFGSYALFHDSRFTNSGSDWSFRIEDSRFSCITDFSKIVFDLQGESTVGFQRVQFEDVLDFTESVLRCQLCFDEVAFASTVEFIDTSFEMVDSAARYRGAAVELNKIQVGEQAILTFKSTDAGRKMFDHDVQMSFDGDPAGLIRFENVNFSKLTPKTRERLLGLVAGGHVEIGPGCIKYRLQTDVRTIDLRSDNSPLVVEICQTFASYFTASNGLNLGFEIVDRSEDKIRFFYFSDEDLSEEEFLARLRQTEQDLWNLLSADSVAQLPVPRAAEEAALTVGSESAAINAIDGISALIGTFFRVGVRIAMGRWQEADTRSLLEAIRFNEAGAEERAQGLHQVIAARYTGKTLFGLSARQNGSLPLLEGLVEPSLPEPKTKILFLGVNSRRRPLGLDHQIKRIEANLERAKERERLELRQKWAVGIDDLMNALLDDPPTIVHFAGHGTPQGIVLLNEEGDPHPVPGEALAELFRMFEGEVRCVLLDACFSESQALALRRHVPYVIGLPDRVHDSTSINFATGFYKAIGAGRDIPYAYDFGMTAIRVAGLPTRSVPVLLGDGD